MVHTFVSFVHNKANRREIFPSENTRDAYASRTARLGAHVALSFLFSNFSNREQ
jgi:hypothetical protein